jgi:hypothetical protein
MKILRNFHFQMAIALVAALACWHFGNHEAATTLTMIGAVLPANALNLADWAKRLDPDGNVPVVAELLSQTNEILEDALFVEGNLPTGHRADHSHRPASRLLPLDQPGCANFQVANRAGR